VLRPFFVIVLRPDLTSQRFDGFDRTAIVFAAKLPGFGRTDRRDWAERDVQKILGLFRHWHRIGRRRIGFPPHKPGDSERFGGFVLNWRRTTTTPVAQVVLITGR
jgi:hypothetical protein